MTGPLWSVIGFDPETVLPRFINAPADAVRGGGGAGRAQRLPGRRRPGHRPGAPDRADPAARRGLTAVTERHAPRPSAVDPRPPATVDGRSPRPHDALRRRPRARRARPPGLRRPASRLFAITDHDNLAGYRELRARAAPSRAGLDAHPGRGDQRRRRAGLGLDGPRASCTCSGFGVDPDDEAFEARPGGPAAARRTRFDATLRAPARARACRSTPGRGARPRPRDDALGRPTVARALVAAGFARASRTRSSASSAAGMPGYVPRHGSRAGRGDPRDPRGRRPRLARALLGRRPTHRRSCATSSARGWTASRPPPLVRRRDRARVGARSPGRSGSLPTGGTDYHGDHGAVRRGARRARDARRGRRPARARRERPARRTVGASRTTIDRTARPAHLPVLDLAPPVAGRAGPRDPLAPTTSASTEFRPETRALPAVLRLDAGLPDEQERLRGDGRAPARRRLCRGAVDGRRPTSSSSTPARSARRPRRRSSGARATSTGSRPRTRRCGS